MAAVFQQIGVGQWFRYVTGVELAGGILSLRPGRSICGAALLTATMLGTLITHAFPFGGHRLAAAMLFLLSALPLRLNLRQLRAGP